MSGMFSGADEFAQDLSSWCVTRVTSVTYGNDGGTDPLWGTCPCRTGADGNTCENGGSASGDSTLHSGCSCTCTGEYLECQLVATEERRRSEIRASAPSEVKGAGGVRGPAPRQSLRACPLPLSLPRTSPPLHLLTPHSSFRRL
jgi:hypothetical protein